MDLSPLLWKLKLPKSKALICIILIFVLSRLFYFHAGIRFNAAPLYSYWQYIDPYLLRNDLFQSIYYLHSQPPMFNLFLASVIKISPHKEIIVFNLIYLGMGMVLVVFLFLLMIRLEISIKLAWILTIIFMISPPCILFENWLFYTYPLTTLLCLSALFLHKFTEKGKLLYCAIFFVLLASIVLTRSLFHILWYFLFVLIILYYRRDNWKGIVFISGIPFLVIFLLYAKNLYTFGSFTTSTWLGMNFSRLITINLSEEERFLLARQGKISNISLIKPFSSLEDYKALLPEIEKTNIHVLDQELKSSGIDNYNNIAYIYISRQYLKDAFSILISHPEVFLKGLLRSFKLYFIPSGQYAAFRGNKKYIEYMDRFYNVIFYGQLLYKIDSSIEKGDVRYYTQRFFNMGLFIVLILLISIFYGLYSIIKAFSEKTPDLPFALTVLFLWINIMYITLVGNFFELGENNRFRFMIDPFLLVIFGLFLKNIWKKFPGYELLNPAKN